MKIKSTSLVLIFLSLTLTSGHLTAMAKPMMLPASARAATAESVKMVKVVINEKRSITIPKHVARKILSLRIQLDDLPAELDEPLQIMTEGLGFDDQTVINLLRFIATGDERKHQRAK